MGWPTTTDPRTEFVTVRFTLSEAADLDWLMSHLGVSNRSAAAREAIGDRVSAERQRLTRSRSKRSRAARGTYDED